MPRTVDPSTIKKGSGMANQNSVDSNSFTDEVIEGQNHGLEAHIKDPHDAHAASAISTTGSGVFFEHNVQGNLDELSALVPPMPPTLGNFSKLVAFNGIPDWGVAKLRDGGFVQRGEVTPPDPDAPTNDFYVYQEFWYPPYDAQNLLSGVVADNPPGDAFTVPGNDPATDQTFNVVDGVYTGGGEGFAHHGGFTRAGPVIQTARIMDVDPSRPVVVSGSLFPADRGVLALLRWPAEGDVSDFLAQPLDERVIAALLCGQGINDECDGAPGGIFAEGTPGIFPSRSAGQYDLFELHDGIDGQTGDPLPSGSNPAAGQVRLGTDPDAGVPVLPDGIPILGGTTIARGGGDDNNYFRYRLPYLEDYSQASGISHTPAIQRPRFFTKPAVSLDPVTDLDQAGNYSAFPKDYWTFQVSRYRHRFTQSAGPDQGSYLFLHFRREADFEAFVRDGIMPDHPDFGYELWSAGLANYNNPESTDNLIDAADPNAPITSGAYHVARAATFEDADVPLVTNALGFTYARTPNQFVSVSGVKYFTPSGSTWNINSLEWSVDNLWNTGYLLGNTTFSADITPGLWHKVPAVLYLGMGTSEANILNGLGVGYFGTATYQRVDFDYTNLDSVSGPFDLTNGPDPGDSADLVLLDTDLAIRFSGDDERCHFWTDARLRLFARKPLNNQDPANPATEFLFPRPGGARLLLHTTSHRPAFDSGGNYGNFKVAAGDEDPRPNLENPRKDVEERFLDEVYRVSVTRLRDVDPTWVSPGPGGNLDGPGLPHGAAPIELPVRWASEPLAGFGQASYLRADLHLEDLATSVEVNREAQVVGLPDRNPPATDGVENPVPFSGMLIYPQTDYTTGYRPSVADGDLTVTTQFDYSGIVSGQRSYIRVFDAAYINDPNPEWEVVGQHLLRFRIDGLHLKDFAYIPPGPGSSEIALSVKVPGLTTWMDLGRVDGGGPSKQDALEDGAGCLVLGPNTFDGRDAVSGTVFCQVEVNVGPAVNIFANSGVAAPIGVAPVLVRASIKAAGSVLNFEQGGPDASTSIPRALTGITLLRHSDGSGPPPFTPPSFP